MSLSVPESVQKDMKPTLMKILLKFIKILQKGESVKKKKLSESGLVYLKSAPPKKN
jgi:hypothetical protein